jgi:hypothetical protein
MTKTATLDDIWVSVKIAQSTATMLSDMFEMEYDDEADMLRLSALRYDMYCNVLTSVTEQIKSIADALEEVQ